MLNRLPNGWQESSLLGIADYLNGLAMQKYRPTGEEQGLPVLKIKELRQGSCDTNSELCSPSIKPEYIVHDGDVIFSWSGSLLVDLWCGGTCGLNQHLFEDIYLAIYEYHHYGRYELQCLVDDHSLIEEFALRLAYVASKLTAEQSYTIDKAALRASMKGKWDQFHGDRLLVDDVFFRLLGRLGYARGSDCMLKDYFAQTTKSVISFETFPLRCECELLSKLADRAGVSFREIG